MTDKPKCPGTNQAGGPCGNGAGKGTTTPGVGPCRAHGGKRKAKGGAPKGSKNALTHGGYETLFVGCLTEDELALMAAAAKKEAIATLEEELGLTTVRQMRILLRQKKLEAVRGGMTIVETSDEAIASTAGGAKPLDIPDRIASQLSTDDIDELTDAVANAAGDGTAEVTKRKSKKLATLGQIHGMEDALTAVQKHKANLVKQLHELKNPTPGAGQPPGPDDPEAPGGLDDDKRAAGVAALLERARARAAG